MTAWVKMTSVCSITFVSETEQMVNQLEQIGTPMGTSRHWENKPMVSTVSTILHIVC